MVILITFIANLMPPILDIWIPILTDSGQGLQAKASYSLLYASQGLGFILALLINKWFFAAMGPRNGLILGLILFSASMLFINPEFFFKTK